MAKGFRIQKVVPPTRRAALDGGLRFFRRLLLALPLLLFASAAPADAAFDAGLAWLEGAVQEDGSFATTPDVATPFQATAEVLQTYRAVGRDALPTPAFAYLDAPTYTETEYIARRIKAETLVAQPAPDLLNSLVAALEAAQNADGGFGADTGFESTALDTAYALSALAAAGRVAEPAAARAVAYLGSTRDTAGAWVDSGGEPSVFVTALAMKALWLGRHHHALNEVLDGAQSWLLSRREAGLWGQPAETALALLAILPRLPDVGEVQASVDLLRGQQRADGSWGENVYATALALRALALSARPVTNPDLATLQGRALEGDTGLPLAGVAVRLDGAAAGLTGTDGRFELRGLVPGEHRLELTLSDYGGLTTVTRLTNGETRDLGDLLLVKAADPQTATLRGRVTDADTGLALEGVLISTDQGAGTSTAADGSFQVAGILPGTLVVSASAPGYGSASGSADVAAGGIFVFSPALTRLPPPSEGEPAAVFGQVTAADGGTPIAGALVTATGSTDAIVETDADGRYRIEPVEPGDLTVRIDVAGHASVVAQAQIAPGQQVSFSPVLSPVEPPPSAVESALYGRVTNFESGDPIAGASLFVSGVVTQGVVTDGEGYYLVSPLPAGQFQVDVSAEGFQPASLAGLSTAGEGVELSVALLPQPPAEAPTTVLGVVVDSTTAEPLAGVPIEASYNGLAAALVTDADGRFLIEGIASESAELRFAPAGYRPSTLALALETSGVLDIGQVRLRPEGADRLLPDLVVTGLDRSQVDSDPATLAVGGQLAVGIRNQGTAATGAGGIEVWAFYDADADGTFLDGEDWLLGAGTLGDGLEVDQGGELVLTLSGELPFRDAPISLAVDPAGSIAELDERNNTASTSELTCRVEPVSFAELSLVEKWRWSGVTDDPALRNRVHAVGTVLVGQLSDDDGDGRVSGGDVPDLVFAAANHPYSGSASVLVALSGDDGHELWRRSDLRASQRGAGALGDIDGDGLLEVVVTDLSRSRLMALENDGTTKWSVPAGPTNNNNISDGLSIVDLDADGSPEIVQGRRVYDNAGNLLWTGEKDRAEGGHTVSRWGLMSIAADVDLDGYAEVIAGRTLYDSWGNTRWHRGDVVRDGYNAIGNFDDDDFAEILLVTAGRVYLLEHTGETIWGPVALPGGGNRGGAPTVGDFDGDGEPEIGVAGATRYSVLEADGSILWTSPTKDLSSAATGSSLFDFDGDGRVEVVYADETHFRIYNGADGEVLVEIPNGSVTSTEYPVVADVDGDGGAEIVLPANYRGGFYGVRVFEPAAGQWANTRALWNQHSCHITNIGDDGSIPRQEEPSWLSHNTYRLNTFPDRDPLAAADLTVALLTLIDNGTGEPYSLSARVGNGGALAPREGARVAFYEGDPDAAGELLGELDVGDLPAPGFRDVRLDGVTLRGLGAVYAVVDPAGTVEECDEANNRAWVPADAAAALGALTVSTDAPGYGPNAPVRLLAGLANTGSFPSDYRVELSLQDGGGQTVATFAPRAVPGLAAGAATDLEDSWDTGVSLTGDYRLRGLLFDGAGRLLDEAEAAFTITTGDSILAALALTTDRPVYHTTDRAVISARSRNLTVNHVLGGLRLELTLHTPGGVTLPSTTRDVGELVPGGGRETLVEHDLFAAQEGDYRVHGRLFTADGTLLAEAETQFSVREDLARALSGTVAVAKTSLEQGDTQLCTERLRHGGTLSLDAQPVRRLLVRLGVEEEPPLQVFTEEIPLEPGDERTWVRDLDTTALAPGSYACLLQAGIEGAWVSLDAGAFILNEPPIAVDAGLGLGAGARLLVLLDPSDKDELQQTAEREFLRSLLDSAGWSYTLVDDADAFTRELYGGGYGLFLLQSARVKLAQETQQVLVEAVNNGAGLVVAGDHDERNHYLDAALGVANQGKHADAGGVSLTGEEPFGPEAADFALVEHPQRIDSAGSRVLGYFSDQAGNQMDDPAVTALDYGVGRSLYFAFDLLAEATAAGDLDAAFARLLLAALGHAEPELVAVAPGAVLPIVLTLQNQGIAVDGRAQLLVPPGAAVVDAGGAVHEPADTLSWPYRLEVASSLALKGWLRLPRDESSLDIEALVQIGTAPYYADHRRVTLALQPESPPGLIAALQAMGEPPFDAPRRHLEKAEWQLAGGNAEKALKELLKGARALAEIDDPAAPEVRRWVDNAIAETAAAVAADLQD